MSIGGALWLLILLLLFHLEVAVKIEPQSLVHISNTALSLVSLYLVSFCQSIRTLHSGAWRQSLLSVHFPMLLSLRHSP